MSTACSYCKKSVSGYCTQHAPLGSFAHAAQVVAGRDWDADAIEAGIQNAHAILRGQDVTPPPDALREALEREPTLDEIKRYGLDGREGTNFNTLQWRLDLVRDIALRAQGVVQGPEE